MDDKQKRVDEAALRKRVEKKLEKRKEFHEHLSSYIGVNLMLWMIWLFTGPEFDGIPWPMWVSFWWGIGMIGHAWSYYSEYGFLANRNEDLFEREMAREYARMYGEKPKNDDLYVYDDEPNDLIGIGEDGELIYRDDHTASA